MEDKNQPPSRGALVVRVVVFVILACIALAMAYARLSGSE